MESPSTHPTLTLTDAALAAAEDLAAKEAAYAGMALRVYIEGKGCDGFTYGVTFDAASDGDVRVRQGAIELVCDAGSVRFLHGATIDWIDDERGRGFLVQNPNHRKFRGKFFRRPGWDARF